MCSIDPTLEFNALQSQGERHLSELQNIEYTIKNIESTVNPPDPILYP